MIEAPSVKIAQADFCTAPVIEVGPAALLIEGALMEFSATDWVTVALTEATLSREGPPLFIAAQRGCIAAAKVMCEAGSNLEVMGPRAQRPLHAAAAGGHAGIVAILLGAGCLIDVQDEDGNTPLIAAVLNGQAASAEILLAVGADVTLARLDGMTARHIAELPGTPNNLRELLALGDEQIPGLEDFSPGGVLVIQ